MSLFLAIDAGGTKTECLLADEHRVLARASTGTVKLMRVSEQVATARLERMLEEVAAAAGVELGQVTRTCFGLAGLSSAEVPSWAVKTVSAIVGGELLLFGDEEIALDAAFAGGPGILVIAGTGSNAIGRTGTGGALFRAGGWGPMLGDEGSGYWIGLESIRAALRAQDRIGRGGVSTCLLRDIERHWGLGSVSELVALANQRNGGEEREAPDFASLAPVVARCAEEGDVLAAGILDRAGEELADLASLVFHKMMASLDGAASAGEIEIAFTGSVLAQIVPVRVAMAARLATSIPGAVIRESPVNPLDGALWRARRATK